VPAPGHDRDRARALSIGGRSALLANPGDDGKGDLARELQAAAEKDSDVAAALGSLLDRVRRRAAEP
jgi:hypothetical protein